MGVVWRWRKAVGVEGPAGTAGSRRLIEAAAKEFKVDAKRLMAVRRA